MAKFGDVFSVKHSDRRLTHEELVRAIRLSVAAEYEAVQLYQQLAESIDDPLSRAVLADIAEEELVHAGEFLRLLRELEPKEEGLYADGAREVEDVIARLGEEEPPGVAELTGP